MGALGSDITTARGFTVSDRGLVLTQRVDTNACVIHTKMDKLTAFLYASRASQMFTYTPNLCCSLPRQHFGAA